MFLSLLNTQVASHVVFRMVALNALWFVVCRMTRLPPPKGLVWRGSPIFFVNHTQDVTASFKAHCSFAPSLFRLTGDLAKFLAGIQRLAFALD
jgi:hypothetical protein